MTDPGTYTFVPYFRQGVASWITETDDPGATDTGRATVDASLSVDFTALPGATVPAVPNITRHVEVVSPADVASIKAGSVVLRVHPPVNSREATPGELAYVEFYDEDLPWRYTPASPASFAAPNGPVPRLRPWLALFVLAAGEFTVQDRVGQLSVLSVADGTKLPTPEENWAWAHAQLAGIVANAAAAGGQARQQPDASLSRLLSPRHLEPYVAYTAFVVPAYETGRRTGLQLDPSTATRQAPSWGAAQTDHRWPIYYSWAFTTSGDGSFEYFCRTLTAQPVGPDFGKRTLDVSAVGYDLNGVPIAEPVELEGALQPPPPVSRTAYPDTPGATFVTSLMTLIDEGNGRLRPGADVPDDPGIVPTAYGARHAGVEQLADVADADQVGWVREVNLDLRERAAAGLGAQVIRMRQDELMTRAWQQLSQLRDTNQRLREAELAVAATTALFAKHLNGSGQDRAMLLTAPTHHGLPTAAADALVGASASVRAVVTESPVPSATQDPAFRRLTRPGRPLLRQATGANGVVGFQDGQLINRFNARTLSAAPPMPAPVITVSLSTVTTAAQSAATAMAAKAREPKRVFWNLLVPALAQGLQADGTLTLPTVAALQAALVNPPSAGADSPLTAWEKQNPGSDTATIDAAVKALVAAIQAVNPDGLSSAIVVVEAGAFKTAFGKDIASKGGSGVTIASSSPPAGGLVSRTADDDGAGTYDSDLGSTGADLTARLNAAPTPVAAIGDLSGLATGVLTSLRPSDTVTDRVVTSVAGLADVLDRQAQQRARQLQPVLAYPTFPDPMILSLQALGEDFVLPNISDLPDDSMTLMAPNQRFLEAFFAGLNTEFARELLWREYPTDQRGSYLQTFWERRDALADRDAVDVKPLHQWVNPLGQNAPTTGLPLVLVIRSELLRKFPNTVVYAQAAVRTNGVRTLDLTATPLYPSFHSDLAPDVSMYGFTLDEGTAKGDATNPGYYFVLKERPGQPRFGLDVTASTDYDTWDDLSWPLLSQADEYLTLSANAAVATPSDPEGAHWATNAADLAAILFRSPVMYARHADDMLPS